MKGPRAPVAPRDERSAERRAKARWAGGRRRDGGGRFRSRASL